MDREEIIIFAILSVLLSTSMWFTWRLGKAQGERDAFASLRKDPNAKP
jgi:hypothetical protein